MLKMNGPIIRIDGTRSITLDYFSQSKSARGGIGSALVHRHSRDRSWRMSDENGELDDPVSCVQHTSESRTK